jgi:hypothetical protein
MFFKPKYEIKPAGVAGLVAGVGLGVYIAAKICDFIDSLFPPPKKVRRVVKTISNIDYYDE